MRILQISRQFCPVIGGAERFMLEYSRRLLKVGIEPVVLTINRNLVSGEKFIPFEEIEGIKVYRIPAIGYYKKPLPINLGLAWKLFTRADIIHIHDLRFLFETSLFLKFLQKKPVILSTYGLIFHTPRYMWIKKLFFHEYLLRAFGSVDKIVAISKPDYFFLKKYLKDNSKLILLDGGVDYKKFSLEEKNIERGRLLYVGRIDENKGLDRLFKSLSLIKKTRLRLAIAGGGQRDVVLKLQKLSQQLRIEEKIEWLGFLNDEKIIEQLKTAQYFIFPSRYEGFGIALLEAMATGTAPIVSNIPAFKAIIRDGHNGFILNFNETGSTAHKIESLLDKEMNEVTKIGKKAQDKAKEYDWDIRTKKLISLYKQVLK